MGDFLGEIVNVGMSWFGAAKRRKGMGTLERRGKERGEVCMIVKRILTSYAAGV